MKSTLHNDVGERDVFVHVLAGLKQLPSPPEVCLAISRATQADQTTLDELQQLVESDIALSGRLIHVANTATYGVRERVNSVRRAIAMLGFMTVKSLALGYFFDEEFGRLSLPGLPYPSLPRFALATSVSAEALAERVAPDLVGEAACMGLLHESGVILMAIVFGSQYRHMLQCLHASGRGLAQEEYVTFGVDHAEIGRLVLEQWTLAGPVVEAVAAHETPIAPATMSRDARLMHAVLRMATCAAMTFFKEPDEPSGDYSFAGHLLFDVDRNDYAAVLARAAALYRQRVAMLSVAPEIIESDCAGALCAAERHASIDTTGRSGDDFCE